MKNMLARAGAALALLLVGAGCGASTATPEELSAAVVDALATGDFDGYLAATVMTADQGFAICPAAGAFTLDVAKFHKDFDSCRMKFDFTGATVTSVEYKLETSAPGTKGCGNTELVATSSHLDVKVGSGGRAYEFRIEDVVETLEGWRQTDDLNCP